MKDIFYTILVIWIIWRILNAVNENRSRRNVKAPGSHSKEGETTVNYKPPVKKKISDEEGEYVDFEEME
jgi:hypothetical protein